MKFSEFRALLGCSFSLMGAIFRLDDDAAYRAIARANGIHAQIDARKAAR